MKEKIISLLKTSDDFISGEDISNNLGVSRTSIWKVMKSLKEEGYIIESQSRKGYKLTSSPDVLTSVELNELINTNYIGKNIIHFDTIGSTNNKAKELANNKEKEGTLIISEEQTLGKGRLGRTWISPKYEGIWMSLILRPNITPIDASKITQIAAASVLKSINSLGVKAFIKWPNDIVLNNKKVCGILTEMNAEIDKVNYVIVGMGINVNVDKNEFSSEIKDIATSLKVEKNMFIDRKLLVADILNRFEKLYEEFTLKGSIDNSINICKEYSILIGKDVRIIKRDKEVIAKAIDINKDGNLVVLYKDGTTENVISGEVSVRGLYSYV